MGRDYPQKNFSSASKSITKINLNKHCIITAAPIMNELVRPLTSCGITHFGYTKIASDNGIVHLTTHPQSAIYFIENSLYKYAFCAPAQTYNNVNYIWLMDDSPKIFKPFRDFFSISHGITLIRRQPDFCEMYFFAADPSNYRIVNFYVNHMDILENFILSFKWKAKKLLLEVEEEKLLYDNNIVDSVIQKVDSPEDIFLLTKTDSRVLQTKTPENKVLLSTDVTISNLKTLMSTREFECFQFILQGYSAKEVARVLNVSFRTVEAYVAKIKEKTMTKTTLQLIAKYSKYF